MSYIKIKNDEVKNLIHYTNHILTGLVADLSEIPSVPFGPMLGLSCNNVEFALQKHRAVSKFAKPNPSVQNALWDKCMDDWLAHEEKLMQFNLYSNLREASPETRSVIYRAQTWISKLLKKYKFKVRLDDCDLDFTPGSTFVPSKGRTSVRQKLKNLDHWTVTWSALDDALELIWNCNALRYSALEHLLSLKIILPSAYNAVWASEKAFKVLVAEHLVTVVNGARAAAVPKNNETMRFINIEPMFNMLLQRAVALELRRIMKIIGNDLSEGQMHHRNMISNLFYATMDLKNASDSNHYRGTQFMAPSSLFEYLDKWRSYTTSLNYKDGRSEVEITNYKLSSMGNGFTFEWMSLYLLAICRQVDPTSRVYGDDIIVAAHVAETVKHALECLGWQINVNKTFISGNFRESCGAFFHKDVGYITSFDLHYCESISDVVITCNKLRRVMQYHPALSNAWKSLTDRVPALLKGPNTPTFHGMYVETVSFARSQRKNVACTKRWKKYETLLRTAEQLWQKVPLCIVTSFEFKSQKVWTACSDVTETFDIGFYLYAGRKTDDVLRGKGKWRTTDIVIFDDGSSCHLSYIRKVRQGIYNALTRPRLTAIEKRIEKYVSVNSSLTTRAAR